jgi:hypothetical protein
LWYYPFCQGKSVCPENGHLSQEHKDIPLREQWNEIHLHIFKWFSRWWKYTTSNINGLPGIINVTTQIVVTSHFYYFSAVFPPVLLHNLNHFVYMTMSCRA